MLLDEKSSERIVTMNECYACIMITSKIPRRRRTRIEKADRDASTLSVYPFIYLLTIIFPSTASLNNVFLCVRNCYSHQLQCIKLMVRCNYRGRKSISSTSIIPFYFCLLLSLIFYSIPSLILIIVIKEIFGYFVWFHKQLFRMTLALHSPWKGTSAKNCID